MSFHSMHPACRNDIQRANLAAELTTQGDAAKLKALSEADFCLGLAGAKSNRQDIGLAHFALAGDRADCFEYIISQPIWLALHAPNSAAIPQLSQSVGGALATHEATACFARAAKIDPLSAWLGVMLLARPEISRTSRFDLTHLTDLSPKSFNDTLGQIQHVRRGYGQDKNNIKGSAFAAALAQAASSTSTADFKNQAVIYDLALAAIAKGLALDSGSAGPGDSDAPKAALTTAESLLSRKLFSPMLADLLLSWACLGRGHSAQALELAREAKSLMKSNDWSIPWELARQHSRITCSQPERVDAAWLSAATARDATHATIAQTLALIAPPQSFPSRSLSTPKANHPLSHVQAMWDHTRKAARILPKAAIDAALSKFESELHHFAHDWDGFKTEWRGLAGKAAAQMRKSSELGPFSPEALPGIGKLVADSRQPISPLAWRVASDPSLAYAEPPAIEATLQCAKANSLAGFDLAESLSEIKAHSRVPLTPALLTALEKLDLDQSTVAGKQKKAAPRL